ncbi:MAG: 7-cyano-7-deazaguanine synthase [Chloroflexi bacterium]|nr:7-cyano-7-deazaguanine synthase [Chloroflexota bacterium]
MSGLCGWVGAADSAALDAMLGAIAYRGDRTDREVSPQAALGYRWWGGRPGKSPSLFREGPHLAACAGTLAPSVPFPAAELPTLLADGPEGEARRQSVDGAFAGAWWDADRARLTLVRDPFGVRSLYYVEHRGAFYFASELKQLLQIPGLPIELDPSAVHKYLTFSFVPGEDVPIRGIRRLLPGHVGVWERGQFISRPYVHLREQIEPSLEEQPAAVRRVRDRLQQAVARRLNGEREVGLYLSGGLDSSGVAVWLKQAGVGVQAFSLDFGERSVEREQAQTVADHLGIPLTFVPVQGADVEAAFWDLVWKLDLPFGDPVTGPQYLLGQAARSAGLSAVFNGEGGDQLFGGWTNKPMIAAELYADLFGADSREERYLESYHRFYGREDDLYTPAFAASVGGPGQRRALLAPYLSGGAASTFLHRIRLADLALKGSQSILPRAERLTNAWALDLRAPLFDRALTEMAFSLPPSLKLRGASDKHILKLILQNQLPKEIVWRRKYGMSVPITDWVLGPLAGLVAELVGAGALARRGLFRDEYVGRLRRGEPEPGETRRRRIGERLWTLVMLEGWLRVFVDGRGRPPGGSVPPGGSMPSAGSPGAG